jgi:CRISPR-associated endonuclease/helicase Cas3
VADSVFAHSKLGAPKEQWHRLEEHLTHTAELAAEFASAWGAGDWGYLAGLWHDLGKYQAAFHARIGNDPDVSMENLPVPGRVDHATAGAIHAQEVLGKLGTPLCFAIAGHHMGLENAQILLNKLRKEEKRRLLQAARSGGADARYLIEIKPPRPPDRLFARDSPELRRRQELWTRMLFSALIDADRLDTEAFDNPPKASARRRSTELAELQARLDRHLRGFGEPLTPVNAVRAEILADCRRAGSNKPGVFTLTAPTGGGKTLASMAFALDHAIANRLRGVVVVIPFTSIIEQNAGVFGDVLGRNEVVEHHSNIDPERETYVNYLATENWDAPIVVTTAVQLFESLFSSRASSCRKIHRLARRVLVFDEVQTLPPRLLAPILDVLKEFVDGFSSSIVLCTATQPALRAREGFPGFERAHEIVQEPRRHFDALRRVEFVWPTGLDKSVSWDELATRVAAEARALTVVHRRQDARELWLRLPMGSIHLSAAMCPASRPRGRVD